MKPTKAYICGKPHVIQYRNDMANEGHVDVQKRRITILNDKGTSPEDLWDRIIHEAIHVISAEYDLGLEEAQVRIMGSALADMFWRNKWLKQKRCTTKRKGKKK